MAIDIKSGYDFDKAVGRKRCWELVRRDRPTLAIDSLHCTMFSRRQELDNIMYENDREWMQRFEELL